MEGAFFQSAIDRGVAWDADNIGIEASGGKAGADLIAFQFGHVDAIPAGGPRAEALDGGGAGRGAEGGDGAGGGPEAGHLVVGEDGRLSGERQAHAGLVHPHTPLPLWRKGKLEIETDDADMQVYLLQ